MTMIRTRAERPIRLCLLAGGALLSLALAVPAQANPGARADDCVSTTRESRSFGDQWRFTNTCNDRVFVLYCGDLAGGRGVCEGSRGSVYYTHSFNLRPGMTHTVGTRGSGRLRWAACAGVIGFGNDGHFRDFDDGRLTCLRR